MNAARARHARAERRRRVSAPGCRVSGAVQRGGAARALTPAVRCAGQSSTSPRRLKPLPRRAYARAQSFRSLIFSKGESPTTPVDRGRGPADAHVPRAAQGGADGGAATRNGKDGGLTVGQATAGLYIVNQLVRDGAVDRAQATRLRRLVFLADMRVKAALEVWEADGDMRECMDTMQRLATLALAAVRADVQRELDGE